MNCSGTAGGAREGALQGAVGIAMSQAVDYSHGREVDWSNATRFGAEIARSLFQAHEGRDTWYNVNFPFCPPEAIGDVRVVRHQRFSRSPFRYYPSENEGKFFVAVPETPLPLDPDGDFHVLTHERSITVTPVSMLQTDMRALERLDGMIGLPVGEPE